MRNSLYIDKPTQHRVVVGSERRVVYARHDWDGNFVRYVVHKTQAEIKAARKAYLPAKVGVKDWFEVFEHNFS